MIDSKEALKLVLYHFLHEKGEAKKIAIHKTLFYIREKTREIPYSFNYSKYGPFAFGLKDDAEELEENDQIEILAEEYRKGRLFHINLTDTEKLLLLRHTKGFRKLVGDQLDFDTLELYGAVLYAVRILQKFGENHGPGDVMDELRMVRAGKRFGREAIEKAWWDIAKDFGINLPAQQATG